MTKTVYDLFPDINERTPLEREYNAKILARLRQGPATESELDQLTDMMSTSARIADVRRFLQETEDQTIDCVATTDAKHLVTRTYIIELCLLTSE